MTNSAFIASIKASISDGMDLSLPITTSLTRLNQRQCGITQLPGKVRWSIRHAMPTDPHIATAAQTEKVPRLGTPLYGMQTPCRSDALFSFGHSLTSYS